MNQTGTTAYSFGDCREGQISCHSWCFKFDATLLAAGYLTYKRLFYQPQDYKEVPSIIW